MIISLSLSLIFASASASLFKITFSHFQKGFGPSFIFYCSSFSSAVSSSTSNSLIRTLKSRDLICQYSHTLSLMNVQSIYLGFDPTFHSLHIGHLFGLLSIHHSLKHGHQIIALMGDATASIGDPSGKNTERPILDSSTIQKNSSLLTSQIKNILKNINHENEINNHLKFISNMEWFKEMSVLDFLKNVGRYQRVNAMLSKDSVQTRLSSSQGMAFHEFSYSLLQAYDFYELRKRFNVNLQLGGSDQWGNMISGIEYMNKKDQELIEKIPNYVITFPLLTSSSGVKFGKSEGNAVWLDSRLTSPFEFYQYFMSAPDEKVELWLKYFTLLPLEEIENLMSQHKEDPSKFFPQRKLAEELTRMVHSTKGLNQAQEATYLLHQSNLSQWKSSRFLEAFESTSKIFDRSSTSVLGQRIDQILVDIGAYISLTSARKAVNSGGIAIKKQKIIDPSTLIERMHLLDDEILILLIGRSHPYIINIR